MKNSLIIFFILAVLALGFSHTAQDSGTLLASAQLQQGTTVVGTCDCTGFKVTATKLSPAVVPAGGCGYQLAISQTYTTTPPVHVPKGVRVTTQSPVTFQSVLSLTSMTQSPATVPNGATTVQWNTNTQLPNGSGSQPLANILLNPNGVSPQHLLVEWLDEDGVTMCRATLDLDCPCRNATAVAPPQDICEGQTATVTLSPTPLPGAQVTWYKATAPCPAPIPSNGTPTTGWTVAQIGGNTCNTNQLTQTTCYQAVITEGPNCTYTSSVATVNVRHVPSLANLTPPHNLCHTGTNSFTLINPYTTANPNEVNWEFFNGSTWQLVGTGTSYTTPTLTDQGTCRFASYLYRVRVGNTACGFLTQTLPIQVDHLVEDPPNSGSLQANPAGTAAAPLCYKQATKIDVLNLCGEVDKWEQSTDGGLTWSLVPGAGTTTHYWTPELTQTTIFRVTVKNGACPSVSKTITINVKPQLAVTLTSSSNMLCPGPVTLTAHPPAGYPPPFTYTWFRNGVQIGVPTAVPTLTVTQPGNYRVVISDPNCGTAKSNVIRIYPRPTIVITGPYGMCQGGSVTLSANVIGGDPSCQYSFSWSANQGNWTGTGQTVTVTPNLSPGGSITYSVTTSCAGCTLNATHTVTRCPP